MVKTVFLAASFALIGACDSGRAIQIDAFFPAAPDCTITTDDAAPRLGHSTLDIAAENAAFFVQMRIAGLDAATSADTVELAPGIGSRAKEHVVIDTLRFRYELDGKQLQFEEVVQRLRADIPSGTGSSIITYVNLISPAAALILAEELQVDQPSRELTVFVEAEGFVSESGARVSTWFEAVPIEVFRSSAARFLEDECINGIDPRVTDSFPSICRYVGQVPGSQLKCCPPDTTCAF